MNTREFIEHLFRLDIQLWVDGERLCFDAAAGALTSELRRELVERKEAIVEHLLASSKGGALPNKSEFLADRDYPLSFGQQRLWFLDQLFEEQAPAIRAIHNNPLALRAKGNLKEEYLREAIRLIMERHAVLRTTFRVDNGENVQTSAGEFDVPWHVNDLSGLPEGEKTKNLENFIKEEIADPIDLERGPVLRASLLRISSNDHLLLIIMHHIVSDGWSMEVFVRELLGNYQALIETGIPPVWPKMLQFSEFALWQSNTEYRERTSGTLAYWLRQLDGLPALLSLPSDHSRPPNQSYRTNVEAFALSRRRTDLLKQQCRTHEVTPFMWLLTVFKLMLSRYTGESDIAVGTAMACRRPAEVESMIGFFANTVLLRSTLEQSQPFCKLVLQIRDTVLAADEAQDVPFERIVNALQPERSFSHAPLFQVMFVLQIAESKAIIAGGASWTSVEVASDLSPYDLTIYLRDTPEGLRGTFRYATDLFKAESIAAMVTHFSELLHCSLITPEVRADSLLMLPRHMSTAIVGPPPSSELNNVGAFTQLFEKRVEESPDAIALTVGEREMTYHDLNVRANTVAAKLRGSGIGEGSIVAAMFERSEQLVIGLVGIAKSGAAYLPLDPNLPESRITYILSDANAHCAIASPALTSKLGSVPVIDVEPCELNPVVTNLEFTPSANSIAYLIYTSGSTGLPKGVAVSHRSLINLLLDMQARLPVNPCDTLAAVTTISFDIAALELFVPLIAGARIKLIEKETASDGDALARALDDATIMQATPSTWQMLLDSGWRRSPKLNVLCGGEALRPELLAKLTDTGNAVWNLYGPTETTIWSTAAKLHEGDRVSIGEPIAGTVLYLLDAAGNPVPANVPGTLFIGGVGVADGYWNRPELTSERFLPDPFVGGDARMYDTGDRCRLRDNGEIEYLGRSDAQVKIRGHRIEPGEIENSLLQDPCIAQAVVVPNTDTSGITRLVGYVVPSNTAFSAIELSLFFFSGESGNDSRTGPYDFLLSAAQRADEAGLVAVWLPERHFHKVAGFYPNPSLLAAAVAVRTKRIAIRAGSVVLPLHDPIRVAEEWAVVDNLSGGRVGIAFASGWNQQDFSLQPERYVDRRELMEPLIQEVRQLWRGESVDREVDGQSFEVETFPRPVNPELVFWVTASNSTTAFELAGRLGANVLSHLLGQTVDELAEKLNVYRNSLVQHGHDPATKKVTVMLHTFVSDSDDHAREIARGPLTTYLRSHIELDQSRLSSGKISDPVALDDVVSIAVERYLNTASLIGSIETCVVVASKLREIGVDEIACLVDFGVDPDVVLSSMSELSLLNQQLRRLSQVDIGIALQRLKTRLPAYMVPATLVVSDRLPLTPSGKIDRRLLASRSLPSKKQKLAARPLCGEVELALADIWGSVLGNTPFSGEDDFFASGGHSLLASHLASRIRQHFEIDLPLRAVFERPSLGALADLVESLKVSGNRSSIGLDRIPFDVTRNSAELSFQQIRQWRFVLCNHGAQVYNKTRVLRITGELDTSRLQAAITATVANHEAIRTSFYLDAGLPRQRVVSHAEFVWHVDSIDSTSPDSWSSALNEFIEFDSNFRFDISRPCAILARVLLFDKIHFALVLTYHGMLMDGWSTEIFLEEILAHYAGNMTRMWPVLCPQQIDYVHWQSSATQAAISRKNLTYWQQRLSGLTQLTPVPSDRPRELRGSFGGAQIPWSLATTIADQIDLFAGAEASTLFMVLGTALSICLAHWGETDDVAMGTLYGNRDQRDVQGMIGFFANSVILRSRIDPTFTFRKLLRQFRQTTLEAFGHQSTSFDEVTSRPTPHNASAETFNEIFLVVHNQPVTRGNLAGILIEPYDPPIRVSRYELCFTATPTGRGIEGAVEYMTALFDAKTVRSLIGNWLAVVTEAIVQPDIPVKELWNSSLSRERP